MRLIVSFTLVFMVSEVFSGDECGQFEFSSDATFPWNVGIYFGNRDQAELVCLGTVIQNNCVLTAAHCFCDNIGGDLRNGSFYLLSESLPKAIEPKAPPTSLYKIDKNSINIHKHYKGIIHSYENDLAIIKANFNFNRKVKPVCVDWSSEINDNFQLKQPIWRRNKITIEDQASSSDCSDAPNLAAFISADKSCTKLQSTGHLTHESEGSGLVFQNPRWYIEGVISVHDVTNTQLSTYTSVRQYINWISNTCV